MHEATPPPQVTGNTALTRTRSEVYLPVDKPYDLVKKLSIGSQAVKQDEQIRRLSIPYNLPIRAKNVSPAARTTQRHHDDQVKTERFERMMDRFQLRRVSLSRSLSNNSTSAQTTQREMAYVIPYTSRPATEPQLVSASENEGDQKAGASNNGSPLQVSAWKLVEEMARKPLHPTGRLSQLRMVLVSVMFILQLAYVPFVLVYVPIDNSVVQPWLIFDGVTDVAFLGSTVIICNTITYTLRGQSVTSRRAILRHYRRQGLLLDVLAMMPLELILGANGWFYDVGVFVQLVLRGAAVRSQWHRFQLAWAIATADRNEPTKWLDWLLYSRFGHILRICRLVALVGLFAHYLACLWTLLTRSKNHDSALANHLHSIYDILQLLQGQGLPTATPAQDLFCSFAVLLGSILMAVVFGHVAVLVANFTTNETAYQRKMEQVFAIMDKLQLPHLIRERVHQYYEYLHAEYESLDGEIGKFTKDLSHTLELEVVLFKYMDVVTHVPHWRDCSPDFQKQLVLNMSVRVYLPDDFIIRCGEVGTSCFIVSRGVCKQYEYPGGNDEPATSRLPSDYPERSTSVRRGSTSFSALRYLVQGANGSNQSPRPLGDGQADHITLSRGQAIGEKALFTNYTRTSDVRAFTYVEMCVLEREPFQQILTRYPQDRRAVLSSFVRQCMRQRELQGIRCELMTMVHHVEPLATVEQGVALIVEAMNRQRCDPTIMFGVTERIEDALQRVTGNNKVAPPEVSHNSKECLISTLADQVGLLQAQINRIEDMLLAVASHIPTTSANEALRVSHIAAVPEREQPSERATTGLVKVAPRVKHHPARMSRRASDTFLHSPVSPHSQYADRLFRAHNTTSP